MYVICTYYNTYIIYICDRQFYHIFIYRSFLILEDGLEFTLFSDFHWRFVFIRRQKILVISIFEPKTWQLLGSSADHMDR